MPAPPTPKYGMDDLVYLETSARVGFLEAYKVSNLVRSRGRWVYSISVNQKPPAETTVGGMVDLKTEKTLWFDETELIDFHEALLLVKNSLELKLARVNTMLNKYFPEGTATDA